MPHLDNLDLAILAALEENARIPVAELARRLSAPGSTIRDRIQRLEEEGVILGYTARIDATKLGLGIKAILQVARDARFSLDEFHRESADLPAATVVQLVTGQTDELITVYATDVAQLKEIIYDVVGALPGVTRSNTAIVLEETRLPLMRGVRSEA
jgi:DNA-binding Lrp family transcriptional regulator